MRFTTSPQALVHARVGFTESTTFVAFAHKDQPLTHRYNDVCQYAA